jgi:hypothetical protein
VLSYIRCYKCFTVALLVYFLFLKLYLKWRHLRTDKSFPKIECFKKSGVIIFRICKIKSCVSDLQGISSGHEKNIVRKDITQSNILNMKVFNTN